MGGSKLEIRRDCCEEEYPYNQRVTKFIWQAINRGRLPKKVECAMERRARRIESASESPVPPEIPNSSGPSIDELFDPGFKPPLGQVAQLVRRD